MGLKPVMSIFHLWVRGEEEIAGEAVKHVDSLLLRV
jgi:hypothetical protein